jgi:hypothetical protein
VNVTKPGGQTLETFAARVGVEDGVFTVNIAPVLVTGLPPPVEVIEHEYVAASPVATALMDNEFVAVPTKCPSVKLPEAFFH